MNEIVFLVEQAPEGGLIARALSEPIFTEADTETDLLVMIRDAVACHFEPGQGPKVIRLHFVREQVIAG
jgi:sulfur relay (sulfurtransferase) DsrF/TusC family protein